MKCPKCEGRGWYETPRYPLPGNWAGEPTKKCGKCQQSGYIIGNVKDVLDFLSHLKVKFRGDPEYLRQTENCIATIKGQPQPQKP